MRKTKRSAFTIVELVIVIAVIAILSAVLIPTFGAIIKNANVAADQSAAATLTTELHIYLKGETIDSEAELMDALDKSGIDEKLVPKALNHDHHFWFDMENQMIVAGFTEDIKNKTSQSTSKIESQSGAVLTSAELIAETSSNTAFLGMRDVFNNGFFLIDSADALSSMFGDMSSITKDNYATFISTLDNTAKNNEVYGVIAEKVLENVAKTTIFTNGGVFYFSENTADSFVFFADGVKVISNTHYVYDGSKVNTVTNGTLPAPKGALNLPSSVVLVEEDSLDFGVGNSVVINTTLADANEIANVFSPLASDATIKDKAGVSYKIVHLDTLPEGDTHEKDRLVLASDNTWMADLIVKLPFEDYTIGYTEEDSLVEFNTDTLYVSNLKSDDVVLFAKDTKSDATSLSVFKWESDNAAITVQGGVLSFDEDAILAGSHRATITATAKNINGENIVRTLKVEVRIVESATVKIGDYDYPLGQGDQHLSYYVSAQNHTITPDATVYWKQIENETLYDLRAGDLVVKDGAGQVCTDNTVSFGADSSNYSFTVSVDGRLETKFTVAVIDLTNAPFQLNFHHSSEYSPYYVGSGDELKLSDIFNLKEGFDFQGATVTVYGFAEGGTDLYSVYEINNYRKTSGQLIWADEDTINISKDEDWKEKTIRFRTDNGYSHTSTTVTGNYDVVIEIAPVNDVAMIAHVVVVGDATNASNAAELTATHSSSVILHDDVTVTDGNHVVLGANNLYGNGYIITADKYISTKGESDLTDALITVNGGTIENIYLDGPVYPTLDYYNNANKYYVSGIRAEGTSTINKSYVSGFRQPISADGTLFNVIETTLRGGNYANLLVNSGNLYMKDVTTIQDPDGIKDTINTSNNVYVIGMGIAINNTAIDGDSEKVKITVEGKLDQFNWISKKSNATMPVIPTYTSTDADTKEIFGKIFNGHAGMRIGRFMNFIHQDGDLSVAGNRITDTTQDNSAKNEYINAGIVFVDVQTSSSDTVIHKDTAASRITISEPDNAPRKHSVVSMQLSKETPDMTSILGGADASVVIWSYKDGRGWDYKYKVLGKGVPGSYVVTSSTDWSTVYSIQQSDLTYSGYYSAGAYASSYTN